MTSERLSLAMGDEGLPQSGRVLVLRAKPESDLSALPKERTLIVQGFRPDHDALAAQGWTVSPTAEGDFAAAVVFATRSRAESRALVALAAARVGVGGAIWVDGAKTDGIDTLLKDIRQRVPMSDAFAKAHGKSASFANPGAADFSDWTATATQPAPGFQALPGSFSADGVDAGSVALAAALPMDLKGRVADFGAGWGWLSAEILKRPKVTSLTMIEAEWAALQSARANIEDDRASFHWADATALPPMPRVDVVVMNPPFHRGREGDPALGVSFIRAAAKLLQASGTLWMVANRHLPYEQALQAMFVHVEEVAGTSSFKVFRAVRPVTRPQGTSGGTQRSPTRRGR